jgi:hypothetical protein
VYADRAGWGDTPEVGGVSISIVLYPMTIQEIANKIKRAVGTKYGLEYYDHCEFNCPAGCNALYVCELYVIDKYTNEAVAKIDWAERVECICHETWCEPDRRILSKPLKLEDMGLPQDKKDKLEKIIAKVNERLKET